MAFSSASSSNPSIPPIDYDKLIAHLSQFSEHCRGKSISQVEAAQLLGLTSDTLVALLKEKKDAKERYASDMVYNAVLARAVSMLNVPMAKAKAPPEMTTCFESCSDVAYHYLEAAKDAHGDADFSKFGYPKAILDAIALMEEEKKKEELKRKELQIAQEPPLSDTPRIRRTGKQTVKLKESADTAAAKTAELANRKKSKVANPTVVPLEPLTPIVGDPDAPKFRSLTANRGVTFDSYLGLRFYGIHGCQAWMAYIDDGARLDLTDIADSCQSAAVSAFAKPSKKGSVSAEKLANGMTAYIKKIMDALKTKSGAIGVLLPDPINYESQTKGDPDAYGAEQCRPLKLMLAKASRAVNLLENARNKDTMVKALKITVQGVEERQLQIVSQIEAMKVVSSATSVEANAAPSNIDRTSSDIMA